jgi:hypothetical protein
MVTVTIKQLNEFVPITGIRHPPYAYFALFFRVNVPLNGPSVRLYWMAMQTKFNVEWLI